MGRRVRLEIVQTMRWRGGLDLKVIWRIGAGGPAHCSFITVCGW